MAYRPHIAKIQVKNKKNHSNMAISVQYSSGGPMIDYNRKLIEKFKRRDNRLCFFHNRLSRKKK